VLGCWQERIGLVPRLTKLKINKSVQMDSTSSPRTDLLRPVRPEHVEGSFERVWIHAVSVGEVLSVQHLITEIKKNNPGTVCYLTVGTSTGKQMAQKNLDADYISFMPYDFLPFILIAINRVRPSKIIIVEAEIWPNFLILSSWLRIDKILINARISSRSYGRYKILKSFFAPIFNSFKKILTQSPADKIRFAEIGVDAEKLSVFGDIKAFNVVQKKLLSQTFNKPPYTTLLVGSIHPGELDIYLKLFVQLKKTHAGLRIILAPRHFTWMQELETKLKNTNLNYILWTEHNLIIQKNENLFQAFNRVFESTDIIAVCKLGELFNLYQLTDIFYLGGTFVNVGGHNLLEPAAWANPCIIGPFYQNTKANADEMEQAGGLIKVENFEQLQAITQKLLSDKNLRTKMGTSNNSWVCQKADLINNGLTSL
jgi:3-deoxy-D-manno-octulosonic-acid transferase